MSAERWVLLEVGETIREGDEFFDAIAGNWVDAHFEKASEVVAGWMNPIRRRWPAQPSPQGGGEAVYQVMACEQDGTLNGQWLDVSAEQFPKFVAMGARTRTLFSTPADEAREKAEARASKYAWAEGAVVAAQGADAAIAADAGKGA